MVETIPRKRVSPGLMLALLSFAQFIVAADYNIVYVALPDIGHALGFNAHSLQWVVSSYAVTFGGLLLFGGRLVDRFDGRKVFIFGAALFGLSCLVGGFAGDPGVLIAARAVQGVGAALLSPATLALVNTRFEEGAARNRALAIWGASGSGGLAAGALLGGVLTNAFGWRAVLFALVPMALVAAIAAPLVLPPEDRRTERRGSFDVPGAVLVTAGASLLVLGLVSGPQSGWASVRGVGSIVAGLVVLAVFALVENKTASALVPMRLFRNRSLVTAILIILVFQSALGGSYYLFTNYMQNVLGYDALKAGLAFLPLTIVSMGASLKLAGLLIGTRGPRNTLFIGMLINGIGMVALAVAMATHSSFWVLVPGLVIWGVGGGVTFPAMFISAATGVAPQEAGIASALATASQQIGGAAGLALLIAVSTARLSTHAGVVNSLSTVTDGIRLAMFVGGGASVLGGLLAFTLRTPGAAPVPAPSSPAEAVGEVSTESASL